MLYEYVFLVFQTAWLKPNELEISVYIFSSFSNLGWRALAPVKKGKDKKCPFMPAAHSQAKFNAPRTPSHKRAVVFKRNKQN